MPRVFLIYPAVAALLLVLGFFWRVQNSERLKLLRWKTTLLEQVVECHGRLVNRSY